MGGFLGVYGELMEEGFVVREVGAVLYESALAYIVHERWLELQASRSLLIKHNPYP